jgi:hypothetical protein
MLESELESAAAAGYGDAFTVYLQGLVAADKGQQQAAQQLLITSLSEFPCNWGAWQVMGCQIMLKKYRPSPPLTLPALA